MKPLKINRAMNEKTKKIAEDFQDAIAPLKVYVPTDQPKGGDALLAVVHGKNNSRPQALPDVEGFNIKKGPRPGTYLITAAPKATPKAEKKPEAEKPKEETKPKSSK